MRIEVNPLSAGLSAIRMPLSRHVKLHLSRARKIKSRFYPRSPDRGQTARFSKGDVIPASPVDLLGVPTFLFPPLTKSVILCFLSRPEDVKAVGSEARVIAETVHAIVNFVENKCREKQSESGSGVLGRDCAANDSHCHARNCGHMRDSVAWERSPELYLVEILGENRRNKKESFGKSTRVNMTRIKHEFLLW
jgi:hypothetical protein